MNFNDEDDYLWNCAGEPDADVQSLEQTLGKLRYQHTELKLPAPTFAPRRSRHAATLYRSLLAAGAAFVMLAAGAWLYLHRSVEERAPRTEMAVASERAPGQGARDAGNAGQNAGQDNGAGNLERKQLADGATDGTLHANLPRRVAAKRERKIDERNGIGGAHPRVAVAAGARVTANPTTTSSAPATRSEGERAKAQLMLALHITSDKLAFVQKKLQGDTLTPSSPSGFEPDRDLLR